MRTITMKALSAAFILIYSPAQAAGLMCKSGNGDKIVISLKSRTELSRVVSCIEGSFIKDITPCSANGLYALSNPSPPYNINRFAATWDEAYKWNGGFLYQRRDGRRIEFKGGLTDPVSKMWEFEMNHLTMKGQLKWGKSQTAIVYDCVTTN